MKPLSFLLPVLLFAGAAWGVNSVEQEFTCPMDGTVWKERTETSANPRGIRLDLRQLGDVIEPPTLPQCPQCRFPLFSERLGQDVLDRLKPFVMGGDFQLLARKNPSYFSLAQVQEFLRAPDRYIALSYLRASWQVEGREAHCRRLLEKAREHFVAALAALDAKDKQFAELTLLCGEVERRLEKWDDAAKRFRDLDASGRLKGTPQAPIPAFQLRLVGQRDSKPHALDASAVASKPQSSGAVEPGKMPLNPGEKPPVESKPDGTLQLGSSPTAPEGKLRPPEADPPRVPDARP
jgi:hypothetical protein